MHRADHHIRGSKHEDRLVVERRYVAGKTGDSGPGGMLKVWLRSSKSGQPHEVRGQVVAYGTQ
jgi:hypothetical protein